MKSIFAFLALAAALVAGPAAATAPELKWKPLVTPAEALAAMTNEHRAHIVDIRAPIDFKKGHIAGAANAPYHTWRGPNANPGALITDAALTEVLQGAGVERARPVIVVNRAQGASDFGAAARVYWSLKSAGVERIAILNGGMAAWRDAGYDVSVAPSPIKRSGIEASFSDQWLIDRAGVADVVAGRMDARLVDARPLEFFEGRKKHGKATEAGTLKGALHLIHSAWFAKDDVAMVSTPEAAAEIAKRAGYDGALTEGETLVSFCNTGHWAATNWFALSEVAGIENVKLYPESLVGWTAAGGEVVSQ
ncbi:MAG: rhodanese-like domain-containing protein [Pseudomonadota bacterium]